MHIPPPRRRDHFPQEFAKRERPFRFPPERSPRVDTSRFETTFRDGSFESLLRRRLDTELKHARKAPESRSAAIPAITEAHRSTSSRTVVEETRNPDGSVTRTYSNGDTLTRMANGDVVGTVDGRDYASEGAQVRTGGSCVLR